eukprot:TRINITY_DN32671_c1_g1_i1.p2 TRINITY_DN32671_c1_g1~~TRINITY_DN32671_c1_g1_i1.p2  ORF type:complete len:296 (+),score=115.50 TRINITY_DN32671_c1_g1_i1:57-944(+)
MGRGGKFDASEALDQLKKTGVPGGAMRRLGLAVAGVGFAAAAYNSLYTVQGGYRAIKFNLLTGLGPDTYGAGTHFRVPLLEKVVQFDVRQQPISIQSSQGSRDLQVVNTTVRVLFRANEGQLSNLYRRLGQQYADVVLPSISNEVLKSVIAQYNASELITRRPEVSAAITRELLNRAKDFYIDIVDVSIVQMNFGKEYTAAVESKQIAQQMAERARFKVEQAQQEKKGVIILAQGEAESARLIGKAVQANKSFIELRRLEAADEIARTLSKSPNKLTLDSEALMLSLHSDLAPAK